MIDIDELQKPLIELEYECDVAALNFLRAERQMLELRDQNIRTQDEYLAAVAHANILNRQFIALRIAYLEAKTVEGRK